jgi:hypothetical protein
LFLNLFFEKFHFGGRPAHEHPLPSCPPLRTESVPNRASKTADSSQAIGLDRWLLNCAKPKRLRRAGLISQAELGANAGTFFRAHSDSRVIAATATTSRAVAETPGSRAQNAIAEFQWNSRRQLVGFEQQ